MQSPSNFTEDLTGGLYKKHISTFRALTHYKRVQGYTLQYNRSPV